MAIDETATGDGSVAITGTASGDDSTGVIGKGDAVGVRGEGASWHGIAGTSQSTTGGAGVFGANETGSGVVGESSATSNAGVHGLHKGSAGWGVYGSADNGTGTVGISKSWHGVYGESESTTGGAGVRGEHKGGGAGVQGKSKSGAGVWAESESFEAVHAETKSPQTAAIAAYNSNAAGQGFAIYGKKDGSKGFAGFFEGNVWVSGELSVGKDVILPNADCAEDFDVAEAESIEAGTVLVLGSDGALHECQQPYDTRVAGVVSGAGDLKPAIVLDRRQAQANRRPVALMGKVYCKVDASHGAIDVGDLLTTSPTPGHAMKASDPPRAIGAILGKALRRLDEGQEMIPILATLQ